LPGRLTGRALIAAAGVVTGLLLSACPFFPIPPGLQHGTRESLGENVPKFIVSGKTTREDVLAVLGAADGAALDESWWSYGSAQGAGGVGVGVMTPSGGGLLGVEAVEHRRLVLFFDRRGVVKRVLFEKRMCPVGVVATTGPRGMEETQPCLDPTGRDLPIIRELQ